ncbi:unnamed protein product, partial [Polarella glacialis]
APGSSAAPGARPQGASPPAASTAAASAAARAAALHRSSSVGGNARRVSAVGASAGPASGTSPPASSSTAGARPLREASGSPRASRRPVAAQQQASAANPASTGKALGVAGPACGQRLANRLTSSPRSALSSAPSLVSGRVGGATSSRLRTNAVPAAHTAAAGPVRQAQK